MIDDSGVRLAEDPTDHVAAYCATFAKDSAELLNLHYEADAVLVPQPGHPVTGAKNRLGALRHLLGFGLPMTARTRHVYVAGDLVLLVADWSLQGISRQGHPVDLHGIATDIARRGTDGRWRYVIDNPFGIG